MYHEQALELYRVREVPAWGKAPLARTPRVSPTSWLSPKRLLRRLHPLTTIWLFKSGLLGFVISIYLCGQTRLSPISEDLEQAHTGRKQHAVFTWKKSPSLLKIEFFEGELIQITIIRNTKLYTTQILGWTEKKKHSFPKTSQGFYFSFDRLIGVVTPRAAFNEKRGNLFE